MSYHATKRHERNENTYYQGKGDNLIRLLLYKLPTIWHSGKGKLHGKNQIKLKNEWLPVVAGGGRWVCRAQKTFRAVKICCMTSQWWIYVITHLSKLIECIESRVNHNANYGLWVTRMCWCSFINCNKHTTLVGDFDSRGSCVCVEVKNQCSLYLPFNFATTKSTLKLFYVKKGCFRKPIFLTSFLPFLAPRSLADQKEPRPWNWHSVLILTMTFQNSVILSQMPSLQNLD